MFLMLHFNIFLDQSTYSTLMGPIMYLLWIPYADLFLLPEKNSWETSETMS